MTHGGGEWKRSHKRGKYRQWRKPKDYSGEMVQMDGSHHAWFEDRVFPCVLMSYIDDASGEVFARFYGNEGMIRQSTVSSVILRETVNDESVSGKHSNYL